MDFFFHDPKHLPTRIKTFSPGLDLDLGLDLEETQKT
jgi:hypothetical protein